jgi:sec-independent protein translocase protein TatB
MFDFFSGSHILILLAVLLIVVGPKDLPRLMHMVGQWAGKARAMASEFKKSFDDMARQEELDKLRLELDALRKSNMDVAEQSQKVAEADLPADTVPPPRSGEFQINEPRSGELQINVTPADAFPEGTGPHDGTVPTAESVPAPKPAPTPEPASITDGAHRP